MVKLPYVSGGGWMDTRCGGRVGWFVKCMFVTVVGCLIQLASSLDVGEHVGFVKVLVLTGLKVVRHDLHRKILSNSNRIVDCVFASCPGGVCGLGLSIP